MMGRAQLRRRNTMNGRLFLLASALVLASCGAPLREIPAFLDPSNPTAPESVAPSLAAMAGDSASPSSAQSDVQGGSGAQQEPPGHAHSGHGMHDQAPNPYKPPSPEKPPSAEGTDTKEGWTCPMHPQVTQQAPGPCPKCGMKLVPQQAPAKNSQPNPDRSSPTPGGEHHTHPQPSGTQGGTP